MPNWCNNVVEVRGPNKIVKSLVDHKFDFQKIHPCPADLNITAGREGADEDEAQKVLVAKEKANLKKYGYKNWYDWNVANWGTKWDVGGDDGLTQKLDANTLEASFDSAWAPPTQAYEKLIELGFHIKAYYDEPGMAFCGVWEGDTENGFFDDYCEYSGETSETVREAIGEELDDFWGISENMAQWEEENAEEE